MKRPLTNLELALLGLIHQKPVSGYDLCKVFETTPMGFYSSSPGSIYPALKRLEKEGLLLGKVERAGSMRPRRIFELTSIGLQMLKEWASAPVTRDDLVWNKECVLLRFAFMGSLVNRDCVCRFLKQIATETDALLTELRAHHRTMQEDEKSGSVLPTGRLALGYGIESFRSLARWARQTLKELNTSR